MSDTRNEQRPLQLAVELGSRLQERGWTITTAESCTGGLVAAAITDVAGSSAWFEQGLVTYSDAIKTEWLGVPATILARHGAVSEPCVRAMVAGALTRVSANIAVAVSGIAGPDGATPDKPVGTVWLAWAVRDKQSQSPAVTTELCCWSGDRQAVRDQAVIEVLRGSIARIH